jgi:deazaflavin-dependent oxidoreductase (nitroreductase family)
MHDWATFNPEIIAEFRSNGGQVERFGGLPVIILHTIGAWSGQVREVPLIPVFEGEQMMIYGTAGGSTTHPAWYYNLRAHPRITVESGTETYTADVIQLPEAEAQPLVAARAETAPMLAEYLRLAAPRVIPVFTVTPV